MTAWELIGTDELVRIVGGRVTYEAVDYNAAGTAHNVRLARLVSDRNGLRQISRYVDPDTRLEIVTTTDQRMDK